ncbi:PRD domain-containing protein [Soehngenia longivitae]|uniref:PRD domain-containing protein n=1 Tax=Soehngenia longivitae TaxID=2562294 RepID=A0A4Z0D2K3_9FIRM|nr:BglG family transcription antiterminator [Soehngenia longivitae]TFZ39971.1 PRD domain-containing protein [Soehngenia longivitae]
MSKLSARQFEIVKKLLNNDIVRIEDISGEFNISNRTVYREINFIKKYLNEQYNVDLSNKKEGMKIVANDSEIERIKMDFWTKKPNISIAERKQYILSELLRANEPLKLDYFARKFNVSAATISYDLKDIEKWLNKQDLNLITKPGYGVIIQGEEKNFRKAIINFLYDNSNKETLLDIMNINSLNIDHLHEIERHLKSVTDTRTLEKIEKSIKNLVNEIDFEIVESSYMGLLIHLVLVIKRLEAGDKIEINPINLMELKSSEEYKYAKLLAENIQKELGIEIPESEIGYITIHLKGARYKDITKNTDHDLVEIVNQMIDSAEEIFNVNFRKDEALINGLLTHIGPAVDRLLNGLDIRNPLINDIKNKYKDLFDKTKLITRNLEEKLNTTIPDDEIGYIAMHFGASMERKNRETKKFNVLAVCASGIGTSRMMLSKLQLFPQLNVIDAVSSMKVDEALKNQNVDLIISTIPLKLSSINTVVVNPLLLEEDIQKIQDVLHTNLSINNNLLESQKPKEFDAIYIAKYGRYMLDIFDNLLLVKLKQKKSKDIIREFLYHLINEKIIPEAYDIEEKLLERENLGAIVLPERGFVIYHAISEHIDKPIVAVGNIIYDVTMKNLFDKEEKVHTALLLLSPDDKAAIRLIGDVSVALIEDKELSTRVNKAKTQEELRDIFYDLLKEKYTDEIRREMT